MKSIHLIFILLFAGCASQHSPRKTYKLTILHTNDHHGRFWKNKDGEYGLAARATLIKKIRHEVLAQGGQVLLLDAGDVNTGIPQSDMLKAEPDFKGMKLLKYDAMAIGNHEFDVPVEMIKKQQRWADFPFLSANIYYSHSNTRVFPASEIFNLDGLKVAVLGLTTKDTPYKTNPDFVKDLDFRDPIEEGKKEIPKLKEKNHIVIALTHMGHYANETHGFDAPGDVTLARQVKGLDLIVGGHTQKPLFVPDIQNETIIVQAYEWGKYLGRIDLEYRDGKTELKNYRLIPVNLKEKKIVDGKEVMVLKEEEILPDKKMETFLAPFKIMGDEKVAIRLGDSEEDLDGERFHIRWRETNFGNLVAQAYKERFQSDVGLTNAGGIRDSIPKGEVSYENVMTAMPFFNEIVTVTLPGTELKEYLAFMLHKFSPGMGAFPHLAGVEATYVKSTASFTKLLINGSPLDEKKFYKMSLPDFLGRGGDKYPPLNNHKTYSHYGYADAEVVKDYILKIKVIRHGQFGPFGKIVILQ